ncbi:hypothetical protein RRG08_043155 [Elysia crispata]|uniref:Uncharacterized protein n=1 Tax=Elysia crispata TaxID=231223 RepID=A0AAE1A045_9GAST|nr:hypothetical protein RRG08_043155 [Elysia crispata]
MGYTNIIIITKVLETDSFPSAGGCVNKTSYDRIVGLNSLANLIVCRLEKYHHNTEEIAQWKTAYETEVSALLEYTMAVKVMILRECWTNFGHWSWKIWSDQSLLDTGPQFSLFLVLSIWYPNLSSVLGPRVLMLTQAKTRGAVGSTSRSAP